MYQISKNYLRLNHLNSYKLNEKQLLEVKGFLLELFNSHAIRKSILLKLTLSSRFASFQYACKTKKK